MLLPIVFFCFLSYLPGTRKNWWSAYECVKATLLPTIVQSRIETLCDRYKRTMSQCFCSETEGMERALSRWDFSSHCDLHAFTTAGTSPTAGLWPHINHNTAAVRANAHDRSSISDSSVLGPKRSEYKVAKWCSRVDSGARGPCNLRYLGIQPICGHGL